MKNLLYKITKYIFLALMALTIISLVVNVNFVYDSKQPVNTILDLIIACSVILIIMFIKPFNKKFNKSTYLVLFIVVLIVQILVFNSILFKTGWDSSFVFNDARALRNGCTDIITFDYYSYYPNNMFICTFYSFIFKVLKILGIVGKRELLLSLTILNSIISNITCLLIYRIVSKHTNSKYSLIAYIFSLILLAFSPWNIVPYSDELALLIPILVLNIYDSSYSDIIKTTTISILTFIGYSLKPQSIIIVIAIIIINVININKTNIKNTFIKLATGSLIILICSLLFNNVYSSLGFVKDKNKELGLSHFAMMGLNIKTYGTYNQTDVDSSMNCETKYDRNKYNISIIGERLHEINNKGLFNFISKKATITFNDGSFSCGKGEDFYLDDYSLNNSVSNFLKEYYYNDGKFFSIYINIVQVIWFSVLIGSLLVFFSNSSIIRVIAISLIGVILFQLIFETRARYLYSNVPLYIVMCMINVYCISSNFRLNNKIK